MPLFTTLSLLALAGGPPLVAPSGPSHVVGGVDVPPCGWPSVAAISREPAEGQPAEVNCSATLVHPEILLTAAHCIPEEGEPPITTAAFGESRLEGAPPARVVDVVECVRHPMANPPGSVMAQRHDVAYCRLAEPVTDVPIVPLMSACELDAVQPGVEVTIVGFGGTYSHLVDGELVTDGVGIKRTTTQVVDSVDTETWNYVLMYDLEGSSLCNGDSGGPALLRLPDGTWRVFGAGSSSYTPGGAVDPQPADNECWAGSVYAFAALFGDWLESATGHDLTPCHDPSGAWEPSDACVELPSDPGQGGQDWARGCGPAVVATVEPTCAEPGGSTGSGDTGDDTSSSGAVDDTGQPMGDGTTSTTGESTTTGTPADASSTGSTGDSGAGLDDADDGCGCRAEGRGMGLPPLVLLAVLGVARRRRTAAAR